MDILAFILQFNGYPSGDEELTTAQLKQVLFVDKKGPQGLPNLALVRLVGCLTPGDKGVWTLTAATEPVREREGLTATPQELRTAAEASLGSGSFQLQNLEYLGERFSPQSYSRHRVQVKGALVRRPVDQRISVTSLESVASSCP